MTKEINLKILFDVLKKAWWKILIFTVVITVAVGATVQFAVPKKYASSIEFYVLNTSTTSEYTTTALLSAAEYLANDYIKVITGDQMMKKIQSRVEGISASSIRSMISSETSAETSTFTITVTATEDSQLAYEVAKCIEENAPEVIKSITRPSYASNFYKKVVVKDTEGKESANYEKIDELDLECVKVIREPVETGNPVSPDVMTYTAIAALLAAAVAYVFFLIIYLSDKTIRSANDAQNLVDKTVIGDIPNWTTDNKTDKEDKS